MFAIRRRGRRTSLAATVLAGVLGTLLASGCAGPSASARNLAGGDPVAQPAPATPAPSTPPPSTGPSGVPAPAAPAGLPVIDYGPAPKGFPADPASLSTAMLGEAAHPTGKIPVYDAPGGRPLAFLAPTISGVLVVVPIVAKQAGWVAVLLPSANRTIGWITATGWNRVPLRDQLVVKRKAHQLSWYRDGALRQSWTVTLGSTSTPTPLGRTFVLGRSRMVGEVYAGVDALALGSVPDDPDAVATGLRGAHIGIHSWYRDEWGRSVSNGCVRVPKAGQQVLLEEIPPGTSVVVID